MRATWYVTEDGKTVDPAECSLKNGVLTHKSGAKIAMRAPDCPRSRGVDVDDAKTGGAKAPAPKTTEDMTPEPEPARAKRPGYKTRGK